MSAATDHNAPTVRWGIVGPGRIAQGVAKDFPHVPHAELVAVGSRSLDRAEEFATAHGIERAYGSYRDLIDDDDIDVLYIATPHPQHLRVALAGIAAGKSLLVEKSFTATVAGAEAIIAAAAQAGVFVMEAMWTRFQPAIVKARDLVDAGAIGEVRQVQADLGIDKPFDPTDRLFDPAQGGGAMLDLGVYPVSFAHYFLGEPEAISVTGSLAPTGVDSQFAMLMHYRDGRAGLVNGSLDFPLPGGARITGTHGWIDVLPRFHHPSTIVLTPRGGASQSFELPATGGGYSHELIEVTECVRAGKLESAVMPLADTLAVQKILNQACEQLGVQHREDDQVQV